MSLIFGSFYIVINELMFSPLKETDFRNIFPNYDGKAKKKCHVDFIGFSLYGELFDIFIYELNDVTIDFKYPISNKKTDNILYDKSFVSKWRKCPLDSLTMYKYYDMLTIEDFSKKKCTYSLDSKLFNSQNYYSCLYINELEHYLYLYCPDDHYLYYIRRRGW